MCVSVLKYSDGAIDHAYILSDVILRTHTPHAHALTQAIPLLIAYSQKPPKELLNTIAFLFGDFIIKIAGMYVYCT